MRIALVCLLLLAGCADRAGPPAGGEAPRVTIGGDLRAYQGVTW